jgi:uncharacterized protein DUF1883
MSTATSLQFLHYDLGTIGPDALVEVTLSSAANVQLMDSGNFANYRTGKPFRYHGGYVKQSPYRIRPPRVDHWHVAIDLGGAAGTVRASVNTLRDRVA